MSLFLAWRGRVRSTNELHYGYTMGCPPLRGDNPRALASGLSYIQVDNHGISLCITYNSVDLAYHEIFRAKVGKGGIKSLTSSLLFFF